MIRPALMLMLMLMTVSAPAMSQSYYPQEPFAKPDSVTRYGMDPGHGLLEYLPPCDEPSLWRGVQEKFNDTEREYHTTGVEMDDIIETRFAGDHPKYDGKIARRWCQARANFSDGVVRVVVAELASGMSWGGLGYGLHVCVRGLDPHRAYAPNCRTLRWRTF